MIKRLLLIIAVLFTVIGLLLHINPYIILDVDCILILLVLAIATSPYSFGCAGGNGTVLQFIIIAIFIAVAFLWYLLFPFPEYSICSSTITYPNGTVISNVSVVCP